MKSSGVIGLVSLLVFMVIGAGIGFFMVDDRPDLAALIGAVAGMILGTSGGVSPVRILDVGKPRWQEVIRTASRCRCS